MSISDEIERLEQLRVQGTLTDEEFQQAKSQVINGPQTSRIDVQATDASQIDESHVFGMETNTWCMLMHLSQLLYVAGGAGVVIPIVMWAVSKDKNLAADRHGVAIINWQITLFLALLLFGALSFVVVGIPFLIIYTILAFLFPIMAAIKASTGEYWEYPTAIRFIKDAESIDQDADQDHKTSYL